MQSIEFESEIKEGIITVPKQYAQFFKGIVRIIIMPANNDKIRLAPEPGPVTAAEFTPTINTEGWKFNREEANERR